jgi:hypothetical protein
MRQTQLTHLPQYLRLLNQTGILNKTASAIGHLKSALKKLFKNEEDFDSVNEYSNVCAGILFAAG